MPDGYPIKLVRDNTPHVVNPSGEPGDLWYSPLRGDVLPWLRKKLIEEVAEYVVDTGNAELSHVAGVLRDLATYQGTSLGALLEMFDADPRGGFATGMMMHGRHPEYDK